MKFLSVFTSISFLLFLAKNQKPENATLYDIDCEEDCTYEYKVLKGEIFGFQFTRGRGTCCEWNLLNKTLFNEYYNIQFLKSYIYDYISERYIKSLEKEEEEREEEDICGGNEFYYETFQALYEKNIPLTLKYIYTCCDDKIYTNVSINLWICDEIYENKCINKKKCSEIESPSKENCENSISGEESKCIFDENNNKCIEKKICSLVVNEPEIYCDKATTLNIKTKCVYDEKQKKCSEKKRTCTEIIEGALNVKDEKDCSSLSTSDDVRLKCTLKIEGDNKICREEEKKCLEIIDGATQEICSNSKTTEKNAKCILDNKANRCEEIIKLD